MYHVIVIILILTMYNSVVVCHCRSAAAAARRLRTVRHRNVTIIIRSMNARMDVWPCDGGRDLEQYLKIMLEFDIILYNHPEITGNGRGAYICICVYLHIILHTCARYLFYSI